MPKAWTARDTLDKSIGPDADGIRTSPRHAAEAPYSLAHQKRKDWPEPISGTLPVDCPEITFLKGSEVRKSADRNGSVWKINSENRTDAGVAINFGTSLVGFDHGFDET